MPPQELADVPLARAAAAGDLAAFDTLVRKHQSAIFNLVVRLVDDHHLAADLAQEAFLRAYRAIGDFRGDSSFATWIHRITVNLCHHARLQRRRLRIHEGTPLEPASRGDDDRKPNDPPDLSLEPTERVLREERERAVRAAIESLDEEQRTVVVMRDINGLAYEEIAEALGWPIGTVRSRLHRARLVLQQRLRKWKA
ncbi:MAG: sigma-70 family RNA polymerase sigma factor [Planctomycetes bacterium]|nr:sigma-70 family RNA polymerase sigma factor [Planctomycetota bacterium]MBI3847294.1 sigma-70 family RNA polymerase sigma factor [Planctomycetota bacterium]